jgi:predicted TIM-barrel fold metal-dependent hydrolase
MLDTVGIARAVLVQPAPYAQDHSALLDALKCGKGRLRGIATASATSKDTELDQLRQQGVCGLRFTEARLPSGERYRGSIGTDELPLLATRMIECSMHAQVWPVFDALPELLQKLLPLNVPIVLEHMASLDVLRGVADPTFQLLLSLLREGRIWIKLTVCRRSKLAPQYADLRPFHDALVAANPNRLVWGSDWPFVRMTPAPDVAALLDLFGEWVGDTALRSAILVANPAMLYDFPISAKHAPALESVQ